jgi:hypothetical protein
MSANADNSLDWGRWAFPAYEFTIRASWAPLGFRTILPFSAKMTKLSPRISVDISMKKIVSLPKLGAAKKDARLTIRIPKELKIRIDGIDQIYGVALPKIANECLKAFCEYVERKKQTPTFPLTIGPYLPGAKASNGVSLRRRRGFQNGHRQQA